MRSCRRVSSASSPSIRTCWSSRPGLSRLADFDFGGRPLAAAYDMIFLMDFKGDALARQFQRSRRRSASRPGCALLQRRPDGDRPGGVAEREGDRAGSPRRCETIRNVIPSWSRMLSTPTLKGAFAPLSPASTSWATSSCSASSERIEPIVLHFVIPPKPWELAISGRGPIRGGLSRTGSPPPLGPTGADARSLPMAARTPAAHPGESGFRQTPVGLPRQSAFYRRAVEPPR